MRNRLAPFRHSDFDTPLVARLRILGLAASLALAVQPSVAAGGYTMLNAPMPGLANITPRSNGAGFAPAPVPNPDMFRPRRDPGTDPQLVGRLREPDQASPAQLGYAPGSAFSDDLQRHNRGNVTLAPQIGVSVPLY